MDVTRRDGTLQLAPHDPGVVEPTCERVRMILDGHIVADGPPAAVIQQYHRSLVDDTSTPADTHVQSDENESDDRQWGSRRIEITSVADGRDVHLLGYFFDVSSASLLTFLEGQRALRLREITSCT